MDYGVVHPSFNPILYEDILYTLQINGNLRLQDDVRGDILNQHLGSFIKV